MQKKKTVRGMAGVGSYELSQELYTDFSLLVLNNITIYMTALFVYKCLHTLDFTDWFTQRSSVHHTRFDQTTPLLVPRISNKHSEQSITY